MQSFGVELKRSLKYMTPLISILYFFWKQAACNSDQRHSTRTSCPAVKIGRHLSSQIAVDCERRGSVLSNVVGRILNF